MPLTDAQRKANRKWRDENLDKICLQYRKGMKDQWKQYAQERNLSLAKFVKRCVESYVEKGENHG